MKIKYFLVEQIQIVMFLAYKFQLVVDNSKKKLLGLLIQKFESLSQCLDEVRNSHVQATKNN